MDSINGVFVRRVKYVDFGFIFCRIFKLNFMLLTYENKILMRTLIF